MRTPTYKDIRRAVLDQGYLWFRGEMDLNIIGLRSPDLSGDKFNDTICIAYVDMFGNDLVKSFPATTDPGIHYLTQPINPAGAAILALGQHRGIWNIGRHKGHPALVQVKPCRVIRDNNKDSYLDYDVKHAEEGMYGINLHSVDPHPYQLEVGRWSAGCQVLPVKADKDYILALVELQKLFIGTSSVSYTLLLESDLFHK